MKKIINPGKIATLLILFFIGAGLYSCDVAKCVKCTVTPPPIGPFATELVSTVHALDSTTAAEWMHRFETNKDTLCNIDGDVKDTLLCNSEAFNKKYILKLLCLKGSIGIRVHYGMDTLFRVHQIITGVDQYGHDLYFKLAPGELAPDGTVGRDMLGEDGKSYAAENGMGCPSRCP